jgi:hypothetical protein
MHVSGKLRVLLAAAFGIMGLTALAIWALRPGIETRFVIVHQRGVTRSLAKWAQEDSVITNDASAIHTAEMVGYVSSYYVPGEGYRGLAEVEAALEAQRQKTIGRLVASLERYTGLAYGTNVERWTEWARQRKDAAGHAKSSEPDGAASRSLPGSSETNRTASATGSGGSPRR